MIRPRPIIGFLLATLVGCSGPVDVPSTSPLATVAATAIALPSATVSPVSSLTTTASTPALSASPAPAEDFPADAMVRAVVPGISLRGAPGLSSATLGTLPADSRSLVVSGPVEADGYQWIQLAGPGLPPASGCATFTGPELSCPTWFGWAATGEADSSDLWFVLDPTDCPDPGLEPRAFMVLGDVEALHCYGAGDIEFVGWIPGPEAIREPETCVDRNGAPTPWLSCSEGYSMVVYADDIEEVAIELFVDPASNLDLAYPGLYPIIVGHLDDPAARDCAEVIPVGAVAPAQLVLDCRARFVVTTLGGVAP